MRKTKIVHIGEKTITVKELIAAEIRSIMEDAEKQKEPGIIDLLFPDMPAQAFTFCTGLSQKELENMTQSDLVKLKEVIVELNPLLQALTERLIKVAKQKGLV